uniref:Mos1 transposase HTH domain-containing protein n=1 Tax=Myotis myotis TaxID=51298 RepID=A0A7J7T6M9_MYOMY|nr:hypothetical protein mMyoMyo1_009189 [Myotis myotis]
MSNFVPKKEHLLEVIIHYFILKKSAAESYNILREAYGEHAPSQNTCERWFKRFKSDDFDVKDNIQVNLNHTLIVKQPEWARRHGKVILLHDGAPSHTSTPVKDTLKDLAWEVVTHPPYPPDLAPPDDHLFQSMAHALSEQHCKAYEGVENWVSEWFASKPQIT